MYLDHYNLTTAPFENTPDPRFFFASEQHREALAAIEYTIRMRKGFVLVTGRIGSGKTTVGHTMCAKCSDQATIVQLLHGHPSGASLVAQILRRLDVRARPSDDHARLLERLQHYLMQQLDEERPVVLLVDEAQTLSDTALEELRLLSNFDTAFHKLVQIVLIGQPELRARIRQPRHAALRQRIVMAKQLMPLGIEETGQYIAHRISSASIDPGSPSVSFDAEAVREIHQCTGGVPRLINVACDNCLLLGMVRQSAVITPAMVYRVVQDMVPQFESADTPMPDDQSLRLAA